MRLDEDDLRKNFLEKYIENCHFCSQDIVVVTQRDSFPEYVTEVYVQCVCGEYVKFNLPVN